MRVCEVCYDEGRLQQALSEEQLSEAYYQFGLEFTNNGQFEKAKTALNKCIDIRESADGLASLGYVESSLGKETRAAELYSRALVLQPDHLTARENLRKLTDGPKKKSNG
jgi:tetratricopeptide (TPR) repeat protein